MLTLILIAHNANTNYSFFYIATVCYIIKMPVNSLDAPDVIYFIPNPMLYLLIYTNIIIIVIAKLTSAEQWHGFLLELQMNSVCVIELFLFEFIEAALKQSVLFCLLDSTKPFLMQVWE